MADDTDRKIDALTTLCRHLIDAFDALVNDEGSSGLKNSNAAKAMQPALMQAKQILSELYR